MLFRMAYMLEVLKPISSNFLFPSLVDPDHCMHAHYGAQLD